MRFRLGRTWLLALTTSVLSLACAGSSGQRAPSRYGFDSATSSCRTQPALCAQLAGEEAVVPTAVRVTAATGAAGSAAVRVLDAAEMAGIVAALKECAENARSEVILKHIGDRSPTPQECNEQVGRDESGRPVTRAMRLGEEMHQLAQDCAKRKLGELRPDGFSLEPTYRYDEKTHRTTLVPNKQVEEVLRQGRLFELKGTLVPDVVIHAGDPLQALAVFDFKFPCVDLNKPPQWKEYPKGHPYEGRTQKQMYGAALKVETISRIAPRWGALP